MSLSIIKSFDDLIIELLFIIFSTISAKWGIGVLVLGILSVLDVAWVSLYPALL